MKIRTVKNLDKYIENFKLNGLAFRLSQTSSLKKLELLEGSKYTFQTKPQGKLNGYELNLIKQVKQHVVKLDIKAFKYVSSDSVPYVSTKANLTTGKRLTKELYEIDLSSAYWHFAKEAGIIDEKIYKYALKKQVGKAARLIALGNLAKRPLITEFNGEKYTRHYVEQESEYARLFYLCALFTAEVMLDLKRISEEKGRFLFYWVDAIFFQGEEAKEAIFQHLKSKSLKYKTYQLSKVLMKKEQLEVSSEEHKKEFRVFKFKKNVKKYLPDF